MHATPFREPRKRTTVILAGIIALACLFAIARNAEAKPGFFASQGCTACHYDDAETCNGCHFHGGHSSKNSTDNGVVGTTNKSSSAPGETVSVTVDGGWMPYPNAWVRTNLYDENGNLIDQSAGVDGTGGGPDFPVTLFGTAPTNPGTYQWVVSWFGNVFDKTAPSGTNWVPVVGYPPAHGEEMALTDSFEVTAACVDGDGDSFNAPGTGCGTADCDDTDPFVYPGTGEDCTDKIDNDCDGLADTQDPDAIDCPPVCTDGDGDTYNLEGGECGAVDCDDTDPAINPGAIESCTDGIDNNCNGLVDNADPVCAEDLSDFDIKKFRAKKKAKVGKKLKIQVQVQNKGPGGGSAIVNVYGMMGGTYIPVASDLLVSISKKKGISKHKFYYYPDTPGEIMWHAEVTDGDADTDHKTSKSKVK
jgi:hypothetical protein